MLPKITENLRCERVSKHLAVFEISRPKALNAMAYDFLPEAHELLDDLENDLSIRAVVLTGAGDKAFSAGGDLREEMNSSISNHARLFRFNELGGQLCLKILRSRLPFVAAVNGYAFGAPLAMIGACDLSLASESAVFGLPTCSLGGIAGWGCTQIVARLVGAHNVKRMLLLNEWLDAAEAMRIGLVSRVVPVKDLKPEALAIEHEYLRECNVMPVFAEGIAAQLEKRPPRFETVDDFEQRKSLYARLKSLAE